MIRLNLISLVIALFLVFENLNAQVDSTGKIGISATIQDNQFGFLLPVFLSKSISISPAISISSAEKIGTDFSIGVVPKFYLNTKKVSPFITLRLGAIFGFPSSDNSVSQKTTDWFIGAGFGGEYFVDKHFGLAIELQGNFTKSDKDSERFGNPGGLNFNTATMVSVNIYF